MPDGGHHVVELDSLPDGGTRLRMTESGYSSEQARDLSRGGLDECLDKMAVLVERAER